MCVKTNVLEAEAEAVGYSKGTLNRARGRLGVKSKKIHRANWVYLP